MQLCTCRGERPVHSNEKSKSLDLIKRFMWKQALIQSVTKPDGGLDALGAGVLPEQQKAFLFPCLPGEEYFQHLQKVPKLALFPDPASVLNEPLLEVAAAAALEDNSLDESFSAVGVPRQVYRLPAH